MNLQKISKKIDFKKGAGLIPTIIQDFCSGEVLMLAYMNKESLEKLLKLILLGFGVDLEKNFGIREQLQVIFNMLKVFI